LVVFTLDGALRLDFSMTGLPRFGFRQVNGYGENDKGEIGQTI
jgi:hypothetical protein